MYNRNSDRVSVDRLQATVEAALSEYGDEIVQIMQEEVKDAAKMCVKEISNRAPKRSGDYAKSFKVLTTENGPFGSRAVVGAGGQFYRLTHLLEHGHHKVLWGKDTDGNVGAFPHIGPAEAIVSQQFVDKVKRRLSQ